MKVLLTGADSLVGANLARHLIDNGFTVRALLEPTNPALNLEGLPVERVSGNLLNPESTLDGLEGAQAVFHCAQVLSLLPARSEVAAGFNLEGTRNLLVAMSRAGVEKLVHVGSAFSFGHGSADEPGTEENPYTVSTLRTASLDSLHHSQEMVLRYADEGKIHGVIVNPTLVMGSFDPGRGPGHAMIDFVSRHSGLCFTGGIDVIGARDVAAAILKALGRGVSGRCYILGGEFLEYRELFEKIATSLGISTGQRPMSDAVVKAWGAAGSLFGRLGGKPSMTIESSRLMAASMYYNSERARSELDFSPGSIDDAIKEACDWYRTLRA